MPDEVLDADFDSLTPDTGFVRRHIGPDDEDLAAMLAVLGVADLDALIDETVPKSIRQTDPLALGPPRSEGDVLDELRRHASRIIVRKSLIGTGYTPTVTPPVIVRNVVENPAWYTAYTPYQPEISQGRLEALLNFQTVIEELTGLEIANASLLDEATAAAEAMTMCRRLATTDSRRFFVHGDTHPQTIAVLATRAEPVGIELTVGEAADLAELADCFGALFSLPTSTGAVTDWSASIERVHALGGLAVVATDPLACVLLAPPAGLGADIVVGSAQRFGVPMGFGGPHAGFIACRRDAARALPGRLVGVSRDADGKPALRLAMQTREQHIRRERATSNICTAQVLLANIAGFYAVWHGPGGLTRIAARVHRLTSAAAAALTTGGMRLVHDTWFDTISVAGVDADAVLTRAADAGYDLRRVDEATVGLTFDETSKPADVEAVVAAFGVDGAIDLETGASGLDRASRRTEPLLPQAVFHRYRSEHEMLRYLRRLADKDLALDRTMIPLGSCTMKLNATTEMVPLTWPEFSGAHPFAPRDTVEGYRAMIDELAGMLAEITGYDAVSLQPNAGSQGELAGLLAVRAYHRSCDDAARTVCLIPSSAHGTNAASAVLAGLDVSVVTCDDDGNVDIDDLRAKLDADGARVAAIMLTYPSTHGVFEEAIGDICAMVHDVGGQVYVDGANLNALVGIAQPGGFGADVSHLNLHKTFCIPHGGGGPGVGPVAVRAHLAPFLPGSPFDPGTSEVGPVAAAPFGSASILPISWVYLKLMGAGGLTMASKMAIASANYLAARLSASFPILYSGINGRVGHECIIDLRPLTKVTGVTVDDVAKRLIDFGFHAPTMSFPVAGTLMIEPTESETKHELDRFCEAMVEIRAEIDRVAEGEWTIADSPLRHAPHTAEAVIGAWNRDYDRELGAYPVNSVRPHKYFPPVGRVDNAHGDRNLLCSCEPLEAYQ
ncbi:MAG: aminomethyl-transferring glycine dehydrogenase [Actinomycetota bacterium]|nr:aminomethyl-transferring glycine dehydrogenase [Actinomycetota bacterium]